MNRPICPKCESVQFKNAEFTPIGSNYPLSATFCAECGTPMGLMDSYNIGKLIHHQEKQIVALQKDVSEIKAMLDRLLVLLARKNP